MWPERGEWLIVDQAINGTSIFTTSDVSDIIEQSIVVKVKVKDKCALFSFNTCVSSVKRLIGVNNPFVLTPYQLYKRVS